MLYKIGDEKVLIEFKNKNIQKRFSYCEYDNYDDFNDVIIIDFEDFSDFCNNHNELTNEQNELIYTMQNFFKILLFKKRYYCMQV